MAQSSINPLLKIDRLEAEPELAVVNPVTPEDLTYG
jgi:hypothetical protein